MKKSTILMLFLVLIGSVLIVGVFGMEAVPFDQRVYVHEIKPTLVTTSNGTPLEIKRRDDTGSYYVSVKYEENLIILINTQVNPTDSTNKNLKINIRNNSDDNPKAKLGERGEVIILRKATIQLHYASLDSATGAEMDFTIYLT